MTPAPAKAVNVFVSATGNGFMADIADWIAGAAEQAGRTSAVVTDHLPDDPDAINLVVAPHEFFALFDASASSINTSAAMSIPVCTEQPRTPWFQLGLPYCRLAPFVLDINRHGVRGLERFNLDATHLRLGGVPSMVDPGASAGQDERDLDVLFLGADLPRRRAVLSTLGPLLHDRHADLRLFRFRSPITGETPGVVFGADKYRLLARARLLVNIHRDDTTPGYFEWARFVEAMANGCVVVTEPCAGSEPLKPGVHFVETTDVVSAVAELLDDPERCATIAKVATSAVLDQHPLVESLRPALARADEVDMAAHIAGRRRRIERNKLPTLQRHLWPSFHPAVEERRRVYHALLDEMRLRRRIDAVRCQVRHGASGYVVESSTPAYRQSVAAGPAPDVSAVVSLYRYADVVTETLDSVVASEGCAPEIVVVDDHSPDDSRDVVAAYMADHPDVPILLLGREDNRGLEAARNLGIERARADKIMVMDADNTVYPSCLRRLADALDADPDASFAYATLEAFGVDPGLRSHLPWNVEWLCDVPYIDAQAMVRRSAFERHGGYVAREDHYGWEDWDLWLRLAAAGEHGVHIPQMLGRYRTQATSMVAVTNLAAEFMREQFVARYPNLPWPELEATTDR